MHLSERPKLKGLIILSIDEDVEQLEFCDIAGGNIKYKSGERSVCVCLLMGLYNSSPGSFIHNRPKLEKNKCSQTGEWIT